MLINFNNVTKIQKKKIKNQKIKNFKKKKIKKIKKMERSLKLEQRLKNKSPL